MLRHGLRRYRAAMTHAYGPAVGRTGGPRSVRISFGVHELRQLLCPTKHQDTLPLVPELSRDCHKGNGPAMRTLKDLCLPSDNILGDDQHSVTVRCDRLLTGKSPLPVSIVEMRFVRSPAGTASRGSRS